MVPLGRKRGRPSIRDAYAAAGVVAAAGAPAAGPVAVLAAAADAQQDPAAAGPVAVRAAAADAQAVLPAAVPRHMVRRLRDQRLPCLATHPLATHVYEIARLPHAVNAAMAEASRRFWGMQSWATTAKLARQALTGHCRKATERCEVRLAAAAELVERETHVDLQAIMSWMFGELSYDEVRSSGFGVVGRVVVTLIS